MKLHLAIILVVISAVIGSAQDKTIVLVRHAEKVIESDTNMTGDPELTPAGQERVRRLLEIVKKYKPHEIFATDYKRVRQTVEPIAKYRNKQIQIYDAKNQAALVDQIMKSKTEHYLIAGHSNTIPVLANLLMNKDVFKNLQDSEYGVIWVVKIRGGVFKRVEVYEF